MAAASSGMPPSRQPQLHYGPARLRPCLPFGCSFALTPSPLLPSDRSGANHSPADRSPSFDRVSAVTALPLTIVRFAPCQQVRPPAGPYRVHFRSGWPLPSRAAPHPAWRRRRSLPLTRAVHPIRHSIKMRPRRPTPFRAPGLPQPTRPALPHRGRVRWRGGAAFLVVQGLLFPFSAHRSG